MRSWIAFSVLALGACAAEASSPAVPDHFEVVQGGAQTGVLGLALDSMVRVRLIDEQGHPIPGAPVTWSVTSGGGSIPFSTATTDPTGEASAQWTLGLPLSAQLLRVATPGVDGFTVGAATASAKFTQIAVGNSFGCGLDVDGVAWCWGGNYGGVLGNDSINWASTPLKIGDGSLQFSQLVAGDAFVCGRTAVGAVWCWGNRFNAQLGNGFGASSSVPVQPTSLPAVTTIDAGEDGACGIALDATLWCWGDVDAGATRLVPAPQFSGTGFRQIALGDDFGCGILTDSTVACWGDNSSGQLGQGTVAGSTALLAPTIVPIKATAIDASQFGACAIATGRDLFCWGEMVGMAGHYFVDPARGTPSVSFQDSPASRISLGYICGAVWQSPSSPRLLCPQGWTSDIETLPSIVELSFGYATLCLRASGGVTYCKNYSDVGDPIPFAYEGSAIPAP